MNRFYTLLCFAMLSFFTVMHSESPLNIPDELIEKLPDLIWLKELYLSAEIVSKKKQEEIDKTIIQCDQCGTQYDCSHIGGILSSLKDRKNLDRLKQLMILGDGVNIALFIHNLCNELKIACHKCNAFVGWHIDIDTTHKKA